MRETFAHGSTTPPSSATPTPPSPRHAAGAPHTADAPRAKLLGVKPGRPLLSIQRLTVNTDGRPLELLRSVYLPDYFRLSINLTRRHP